MMTILEKLDVLKNWEQAILSGKSSGVFANFTFFDEAFEESCLAHMKTLGAMFNADPRIFAWYRFENAWGASRLSDVCGDPSGRPICDLADLLWLLGASD